MDEPKQYRAKNGRLQYQPSDRALLVTIESGEYLGFCLACGDWVDGVEPDAERVDCYCGAAKVYGAENLLFRGLYYDGDRAEDMARGRFA